MRASTRLGARLCTFRAASRGQSWRRGQDYVKKSILMLIMGPRRRCASVSILDEVVKVVRLVSHERVQQRTLREILRFKSEVLKVLFAERRHSIPHGCCAVIKAPKISSEDRMMPQQLGGLQCFGATDGKTVGGNVCIQQ